MVLNNGKFTTKQQYRAYSLHLCSVAVRYYTYHCLLAIESRAGCVRSSFIGDVRYTISDALTVLSYCHTMLLILMLHHYRCAMQGYIESSSSTHNIPLCELCTNAIVGKRCTTIHNGNRTVC
jgi:hypothetical protein